MDPIFPLRNLIITTDEHSTIHLRKTRYYGIGLDLTHFDPRGSDSTGCAQDSTDFLNSDFENYCKQGNFRPLFIFAIFAL